MPSTLHEPGHRVQRCPAPPRGGDAAQAPPRGGTSGRRRGPGPTSGRRRRPGPTSAAAEPAPQQPLPLPVPPSRSHRPRPLTGPAPTPTSRTPPFPSGRSREVRPLGGERGGASCVFRERALGEELLPRGSQGAFSGSWLQLRWARGPEGREGPGGASRPCPARGSGPAHYEGPSAGGSDRSPRKGPVPDSASSAHCLNFGVWRGFSDGTVPQRRSACAGGWKPRWCCSSSWLTLGLIQTHAANPDYPR